MGAAWGATSGPGEVGRAADRLSILDALDVLTPQARAAVVLRYYHDYDYATIARILGTSAGNVGALLTRSLDRLKTELDGPPPGASSTTAPWRCAMSADIEFERRVRSDLRTSLDRAAGPHPEWAASPAAAIVAADPARPSRSVPWRLMAVAAVLLIGSVAARDPGEPGPIRTTPALPGCPTLADYAAASAQPSPPTARLRASHSRRWPRPRR